jgi:2-methylcitrate dehydratase
VTHQHTIDPGKVVAIEAEVTRMTYDFTGGGLYGMDKVVQTKEQADHNLPYLLAVALIDREVMPAQFTLERIARADVQALMKKVSVRPNQEYTEVYPRQMPAKITVHLQDGTTYKHEVRDYLRMPSHPFTWEDEVQKFDRLVAGRVDATLSGEIKAAVRTLEGIQVKDLMALLSRV